MSQKIIIEGVYQWNDKTNKFDTVYEDSIDYDGDIMYAAEGPDGEEWGEQASDDFEQAFKPSFEDVSKTLTKTIQTASKKAARGFGSSFSASVASSAQVAQDHLTKLVGDDLSGLLKKKWKESGQSANEFWSSTGQDIKTNITNAATDAAQVMEGALTGLSNSFDLKSAAGDLGAAMKEAGFTEEEIKNRLDPMLNMADKMELGEMEKNFTDSVEGGIQDGLSFIPSNAFTKAIGMDIAIETASKHMAKTFMARGAKVGQWMQKNWGKALAIGAIIGLMVALDKQTNAIGENFGAIAANSGAFKSDFADAQSSAIALGYSTDEMVSATSALSQNLGIGNQEAMALSGAVMDTAKATAIGVDESAALVSSMMNITGMSSEQANNFSKAAFQLATASNVAPQQVLKDMSASSEEIAKFSKGTGDNMAEAAVKAAQLGLSLSDVSSVAEGLLDFQSSIEAEMTASAILGKDLNLQRARELALAGDLVGLQNELLNQVGSQADFEAMNVIERQALADAIGLSVSQVAKLTQEAGKSREELMSIREFSGEELVGKEAMGNITKLKNTLMAIGTQILGQIGAAFESMSEADIKAIADDFKSMGEFIGKAVVWTIEWGKWILVAWGAIKLFKGLSWLSTAFSGVASFTTAAPAVAPGLQGLAVGLKSLGDPKALFGVFVLGLAGPAMLLAVGAIPFLAFMALPIGPLLSASMTGLSTGLAALGSNIGPVLLGILALALLGVAMIPAAYAFSLLAGVDPMSIIAFSASLIILGAAVMGLGLLMFSGWGALIFGVGLLALVALGGAILAMGLGLSMAAPHLEVFSLFISGLAEQMTIIEPNIASIDALGGALMRLVWPLIYLGLSGAIFTGPLTALAIAGERLHVGFTGFTTAMAGVPEMLTQLSDVSAVGIASLAGSLLLLSFALYAIGAAGIFALPALMGLKGVGLIGGGDEAGTEPAASDSTEKSEIELVKDELVLIGSKLDALVTGFTDGTFAIPIGASVAENVPKEVKLKQSIVG